MVKLKVDKVFVSPQVGATKFLRSTSLLQAIIAPKIPGYADHEDLIFVTHMQPVREVVLFFYPRHLEFRATQRSFLPG